MRMKRRFPTLLILTVVLALGLGTWSLTAPPATAQTGPDLSVFNGVTDNGPFTTGAPGQYFVTVTNLGDADAPTGAVVSITLSGGLSFTSGGNAEWNCGAFPQCTYTGAPIAPGNSSGFPINVQVASDAPLNVSLTATITTGGGTNPTNDTFTKNTAVNIRPDLTIEVTPQSSPFVHGTPATLNVRVRNVGNGPTSAQSFANFNVQPGLSITGASGTGWTCSGSGSSTGCFTDSPIPAGGSAPIITVTVMPSNTTTSPVNVGYSADTGTAGDINASNNGTTGAVLVYGAPDLSINKVASPNFVAGIDNTYTITVTNNGPGQTLDTITMTDSVPNEFVIVSVVPTVAGSFNCQVSGQNITCIRTATMTASQSLSITLTVNATTPGNYNNTASVQTQYDSNPANNSSTAPTTVRGVDLAITKTLTGTLAVGANNTFYTLRITNVSDTTYPGLGVATQGPITIDDTLPIELNYVTGSITGGCPEPPTPAAGQPWVINCTLPGPIAPGAFVDVTFRVRAKVSAIGATNITNTATISTVADPPPGNPGAAANNTSSHTFAGPVPAPDLVLSATATQNPNPFQAGAAGSFSFTLSNTSESVAAGNSIVIGIDLPAGVTGASASITGSNATFTCAPPNVDNIITCTGTSGNIRLGNPATIQVDLTAPVSADPFSVVVTVTGGNDPSVPADQKTYIFNMSAPQLAIQKTTSDSFVVNTNSSFTVTVSNVGQAPTLGMISVLDEIPTGMRYIAAGSGGTGWTCPAVNGANGEDITCTYNDPIPAGGAAPTLTIRVRPLQEGQLTNTVTASGGSSPNPASSSITINAAPAPAPDLIITKVPDQQFIIDTNGTFTITVTNIGSANTDGSTITVTDSIPAGMRYIATGSGNATWTCPGADQDGPANIVCTGSPVIAPTNASSFPFNVRPLQTGQLTNTAQVAGGGETNTTNNTANATINVVTAPTPDLELTKSHSANFVAGQNGTYTLTIRNISSVATTGTITLTDNLPSDGTNTMSFVSLVSSSPGNLFTCSAAAGGFTCTNTGGNVAGNTTETLTVTVSVPAAFTPGTWNNAANVDGGGDTSPSNNSAIDPTLVTGAPAPDLNIQKTHTGNFTVGQNGTYTITVTNIGSGATTGAITVTDTLPVSMSFVSGGGGGFTCVPGTPPQVVCTRNTALAAGGGQAVFTLTVLPGASGDFTNQVTVSTPGDSNAANNSATDPTTVAGVPDLTISKTEQPPGNFLISNGTGTYRITVTNVGGSATSGTITVTDTLPGGMTFVSASGGGFVCSGTTTVTCTTITVIGAGGGSTFFDLTVSLSAVTPGTYVNNVTVVGGGDTTPASATRTTQVDAAPTPRLGVTKTGPASFTIDVPASYTIVVTNTGTAPTTGTITVTDTLPSQLTFNSASGGGFTCTGTTTITCTRDTALGVSESATITLNVTPNTPASPGVINTANVSGGGDPIGGSGSTGVIPISGVPRLSISKTLSSGLTLKRDENGSFNLTVQNTGGGPTSGTITVVDTLPPELQYISATGGGFACSAAGLQVTCQRTAVMNPGNLATIVLTVRPNSPGIVTNSVTVSGGGDPIGGSASLPVTIEDVNPLAPGPNASYTINPASVPADNTTTTTLSITIFRNNGTLAAGDTTVTLTPNPNNGLTILPGLSAVTDGSGVATFTIRSSVAQTVTFGVRAANAHGSRTYDTNLPQVTFTGTTVVGVVSAANSTVVSDYESIPADNITRATVTVTLRDANNNPVPGKVVTLTANPALTTTLILPVGSTTSGADGIVRFTVQSSAQGSAIFTASTTDGALIFLNQTVTITFTAPGTQPVPSRTAALTPTPDPFLTVPTGPITGTVVAWRLRVRQGPGLDFPILGLLRYGTQVSIIAKNQRGTWYQIELQTGTAWVSAFWVRVRRADFLRLPVVSEPGTAPLVPIPSPLIPQEGQGIGVVNTYRLRVRTGPGLEFQQIGLLALGTEVLILGRSPDNAWYKITIEGGEAWISAFYVRIRRILGNRLPILEPTESVRLPSFISPVDGQGVGMVNTYRLRIRTGPGLEFEQIGLLPLGAEVLILGRSQNGAWYKIQLAEGTAWTSALYIRVTRIVGSGLPTLTE